MKTLLILCCQFVFLCSYAQGEDSPENIPLMHRYQLMKSQSETYNEYKVIKEYQLDRFWRVTLDTLKAQRLMSREKDKAIAALETEGRSLRQALEQQQASMQEIVFDSTHITVLGIPLDKRLFLTIVVLTILGLLLLLGVLTGKLKLMYGSITEKMDLANTALRDLEEFKRKALEKQIKLSRELQDERNKLMEMKRG